METNKEIIRRILDRLPDDAPLEKILYHLIQESKKLVESQPGDKKSILFPEQVHALERDLAR